MREIRVSGDVARLVARHSGTGSEGAAVAVAPSGALPEPTAHCPRHPRFDRNCLTCGEYYREQIEWEQQQREDHPEDHSGPVVLGPGPLGVENQDHSPRKRRSPADKRSESGPGPESVPDQSAERSGTGTRTTEDRSAGVDYGRYFDVAGLLDGTLPEPPAPAYGTRDDGHALFYADEVNLLFGDPESGKTWLALAAAREALSEHGTDRVLVVDLDHNGPGPTVTRLIGLGVSIAVLSDRDRFLYVEPEDRLHMLGIVADMKAWRPNVVVVDSLGELLPLFGSSSNSADEYTDANRAVLKPLSKTGAAVLVIDHLAKGAESRTLGPGGTAAKRRTIGGVSLRVTVNDAFTPGKGGSAWLQVNKDRHGGLRQHCPTGSKEPSAGLFRLEPRELSDGTAVLESIIRAPKDGDRPPSSFAIGGRDNAQLVADVAQLDALDPPPKSKRDVQDRLEWGSNRAAEALREWRRKNGTDE